VTDVITPFNFNCQAIQKMIPSMSYHGGDFATWQQQARAKLTELLGLDTFTKAEANTQIEYERKIPNGTEIRFLFQSEDGYWVPCHMLLPDGVKQPPVVICLQGHSTGMHISLGRPQYPGDEALIQGGDRDFCVRALAEGVASIAMEQRNFGECGGTEEGPKCLEASMTALMMGRTTIGCRVWDICRLIDLLETEFSHLIDKTKICCLGNSGGGTATAYAAALDDRIYLAVPSCAMCTWEESIAARRHCCCNYVPHIAKYFNMGDILAMACPKYVIQVSGTEDHGFKIAGSLAAFQAGKQAYDDQNASDNCVLVQGNGGHRFYADDAWPVIHKMLNI